RLVIACPMSLATAGPGAEDLIPRDPPGGRDLRDEVAQVVLGDIDQADVVSRDAVDRRIRRRRAVSGSEGMRNVRGILGHLVDGRPYRLRLPALSDVSQARDRGIQARDKDRSGLLAGRLQSLNHGLSG